jgi:acyl carrier protein
MQSLRLVRSIKKTSSAPVRSQRTTAVKSSFNLSKTFFSKPSFSFRNSLFASPSTFKKNVFLFQTRFFADSHGDNLKPTIAKATTNEITERVVRVVSSHNRVDGVVKVSPESHFQNDLGLDSLDSVEIVLGLEEEFGVEIPDHEAEKILSIPDAVKWLSVRTIYFPFLGIFFAFLAFWKKKNHFLIFFFFFSLSIIFHRKIHTPKLQNDREYECIYIF